MTRRRRPYRFPKQYRVIRQEDFDRVYASACYAADEMLVVNAASNQKPFSRLGLSISRRVGNAVTRNRWKRLIREAFRLSRDELPAGLDLVVRPRKGAKIDFQKIHRSLIELGNQIHLRLESRND